MSLLIGAVETLLKASSCDDSMLSSVSDTLDRVQKMQQDLDAAPIPMEVVMNTNLTTGSSKANMEPSAVQKEITPEKNQGTEAALKRDKLMEEQARASVATDDLSMTDDTTPSNTTGKKEPVDEFQTPNGKHRVLSAAAGSTTNMEGIVELSNPFAVLMSLGSTRL